MASVAHHCLRASRSAASMLRHAESAASSRPAPLIASNFRPSFVDGVGTNPALRASRFYGLFTQAQKSEAPPSTSGAASSTSPTNEGSTPTTPEEATEMLQRSQEVIEELQAENKQLSESLEEYKDKYKRSLAEMENVRNRLQKQISDAKVFGIQGFCKDLLEVADVLEKAVETTPKEKLRGNNDLKNLYDGLAMTETQILAVFARHGLVPISPSVGDKFDPNLHEALFQLPAPDKENNTVATVTQKGFSLNERTLRAAKVGVVKNE